MTAGETGPTTLISFGLDATTSRPCVSGVRYVCSILRRPVALFGISGQEHANVLSQPIATYDTLHLSKLHFGTLLMISNPLPDYPAPDEWKIASSNQIQRAKRSFEELKKRHVPVYHGPLLVPDDDEAVVQSPQDVARRTIVLWAVELHGEGVPAEEVCEIVNELDLWKYVSPEEVRFLENEDPDAEECRKCVWRLECLWVLMWALRYIDELSWPGGMCDVDKLATLLSKYEDDPAFIEKAKLRPKSELLDAQDLTLRIHWAIRDAFFHQGGSLPEDLDWSGNCEFIPVSVSAASLVVQERHYVLTWLVNSPLPSDWDNIDTGT